MSNLKTCDDIIKVLSGKKIAFLENGDCLEDESESLALFMRNNNIEYECIFNIEAIGLEETLRKCRNIDVIVYQTTWVYTVSQDLKKAFMSINNPEFKKIFIEIYISTPTFIRKPKGVIHDMYILMNYDRPVEEWEFDKLKINQPYWN